MEFDKQEINATLDHQRKMVRVLRQRLQQRELQEAQYGINVPPEIASEITDLTERIRTYEMEIIRLQTLAAEDKIPLVEAEYRALLSEVWKNGKLEIADATRLELARLKLGIIPVQAQRMETDIRIALARENFYKIPSRFFESNSSGGFDYFDYIDDVGLYFGNSILLHEETAFELFLRYFDPKYVDSLKNYFVYLRRTLLIIHNIWKDQGIYQLFEKFVDQLEEEILKRYDIQKPTKSEVNIGNDTILGDVGKTRGEGGGVR